MNDWEAASQGRVRFREFNGSAWDWTLVVLGINHVLYIRDRDFSRNVVGDAVPGSWPWGVSFMRLSNNLQVHNPSGNQNVYTVALHELGHVLGLQHEHQRWDRNRYVVVEETGLNHWRLPEIYLSHVHIRIEFRRVRVGFITINLPVLVLQTRLIPQYYKTSAFDFNSIMIYARLPIVRPEHQNDRYGILNRDGVWETRYTTVLSELDKQFIRQLYR